MLLLRKEKDALGLQASLRMSSPLLLRSRSPSRNSNQELKRWKRNLRLNVKPEPRLRGKDA